MWKKIFSVIVVAFVGTAEERQAGKEISLPKLFTLVYKGPYNLNQQETLATDYWLRTICLTLLTIVGLISVLAHAYENNLNAKPSSEESLLCYQQGLAQTIPLIKDHPDPRLQQLAAFASQVKWRQVSTKQEIQQLAPGSVWFAVIDPQKINNHYLLDIQVPWTNVAQIKPIGVSKTWAGIFLIHETSHLYDYYGKIPHLKPSPRQIIESEVRAYQSEIKVINLVSQGKFSQKIQETLKVYGWGKEQEILRLYFTPNAPEMISIQNQLDNTTCKTVSKEERMLRNVTYITALGFAWLEKNSQNPQEDKYKFIQSMYHQVLAGKT